MTRQDQSLFETAELAGGTALSNRIVMAPMTRNRAGAGGVPTDLSALYYAQRAEAGLIVTEGTQPDPLGQGYPHTPGLHDQEQVGGWRRVVEGVRAAGPARVFVQLMHCGRISHPSTLPGGAEPVGPSAVRPSGTIVTASGPQPFVTPRALKADEILGIVEGYARAAALAEAAGFDGVELHATSGYLPAQFLSINANRRSDSYGGSVAKRARFVLEVVEALAAVRGPERLGVRIAPGFTFNDVEDDDPRATFAYLLDALGARGLAYLHVVDVRPGFDVLAFARERWPGVLIAAGGFTAESAEAALRSGRADLIAFGKPFISNPDLPRRLRGRAPLAAWDETTFYTPGPRGYVDYPSLDAAGPNPQPLRKTA